MRNCRRKLLSMKQGADPEFDATENAEGSTKSSKPICGICGDKIAGEPVYYYQNTYHEVCFCKKYHQEGYEK